MAILGGWEGPAGLSRRVVTTIPFLVAQAPAAPAHALPGSPRFAGKYDDPDFPGCPREIVPSGAR
eukprot:symbB.v1.2.033911.t1/scaffold4284.1/size41988/1